MKGANWCPALRLVGEWEHRLKQIEQGALDREAFITKIEQMTQIIVKRAKEYERDTVPGDYATLQTPCPVCQGVIKENYRRYACTQCEFSFGKHPGGRTFELPEVEELLQNKEIGPLTGFISKMGRPFAAILRINNENKLEFDFGQNDEDDDSDVDLTGKTPVGPCPKCQAGVYDLGIRYACEKSIGAEKSCDFRTNKIILQQEIDADQMHKLLVDGKTDLLENFVSNRTNRKFKAFLVRDKAGKTSFEFEPRPAKKVAAKKTAAKKATAKTAAKKATAKKAAKKATTSTTTVEE